MTSISPLNASMLTLFKNSSAGSTVAVEDRATQAAQKIADLVSTRVTVAHKQAAVTISAAFADSRATQVSNPIDNREISSEAQISTGSPLSHVTSANPGQTQSAAPRARTISDLYHLKRSYDRVDQDLATGQMMLERHQANLAVATDDAERRKYQRLIDSTVEFIAEKEALAANFDGTVEIFDTRIRSLYSVTGNILSKNDDGDYEWGVFSVNNKVTGEMFFKHDGDGTLSVLDGITQPYITYQL